MANQPIAKLTKLKAEAEALWNEQGLAFHEGHENSRWRAVAHFCAHAGWSFVRNRCPVRAAALAYTTVLALVPVLAVVISISAGLLKQESDKIEGWIESGVKAAAPMLGLSAGPGQTETLQKVTEAIKEYVDNFRSGGLGVTAVLALIFVGISLLSSIETTFNDIWGATRGRRWTTRIVQYWAVISLGPLLFFATTAIAASSQLPAIKTMLETLTFIRPVVNFSMTYFVPFVITSLAMSALYLLLPNTKVNWKAALVGGLVAGALVQMNNTFNVLYASRVAREKSLYGGLAALPLFLVGLYLSWLIILLGAQVAYVFQNRRAYLQDKRAEAVSQRGREFAALRVMTCIGLRYQTQQRPPTAQEMAETLGLPLRLVTQILTALLQTGLVVEVLGRENGFAPARPLDKLTAHDILRALRAGSREELPSSPGATRQLLQVEFGQIEQAERNTAGEITLLALVERAIKAEGIA